MRPNPIDIETFKTLPAPQEPPSKLLSAREYEIGRLACAGLSNKEIAKFLGISPHTVSSHMRHAFTKLGVRRRAVMAQVISLELSVKQFSKGQRSAGIGGLKQPS